MDFIAPVKIKLFRLEISYGKCKVEEHLEFFSKHVIVFIIVASPQVFSHFYYCCVRTSNLPLPQGDSSDENR